MPLIARVMKEAAIGFAALDRIAVTTGPGSFTGLRVGLSAARGIALAAGKPVVGVTTLTAYAAVAPVSPHHFPLLLRFLILLLLFISSILLIIIIIIVFIPSPPLVVANFFVSVILVCHHH